VNGKIVAFVALLLVLGGAFCVAIEPCTVALCDPVYPPDLGGPPGGGVTPCGDPVPGGGGGGGDD